MKLYLTALILGTCLVLAGCPAKEPVGETTEKTKNPVSMAGPDKTNPDDTLKAEPANEDE